MKWEAPEGSGVLFRVGIPLEMDVPGGKEGPVRPSGRIPVGFGVPRDS